jgi:hypothetical protein
VTRLRLPLVAALLVAAATAATAQQVAMQQVAAQPVRLTMRNGLVTLDAANVPVRQILAEWARVGGVAVINGEKVAGTPVTLQLAGVPERQALDIILRSVAGYLVSARPGTPDPAQALFDKVVILATSAAPAAPPPGPAGMAGRQPVFQPAPQMPDPDDGFDEDPDLPSPQTPAFPGGGPPMPRPAQGGVSAMPAGVPPQQPNGLPRYQVPIGNYPPSLVSPQSGTSGVSPGPSRGPGAGPQAAPVSPFGTMPAGAPGSITPVPQGIPLSPTNPGVPPATGTGPATR